MEARNIVVLAVDGLRASALGAYGNTWFSTTALDALASESTVFDNVLADQPDLMSSYRTLWGEGSKAEGLAALAHGRSTLLVTDDASISASASSEQFERIALAPEAQIDGPASSATETATAATIALLLDQLEQTPRDQPLLAWAHLRFASGVWDAPLSLAEELLDEDDPEPPADLIAPCGRIDADDDDQAFAATVRYAAQIAALDRCVGVLLPALDELLGRDQYTLALVGTRGFALGEHGYLGIDDTRPYNEVRHVPLIVRRPDSPQHRRASQLLPLGCVPMVLNADSVAASLPAGVESVVLRSSTGNAYQDEHWKLYQPTSGNAELYSKPDDRWEMNDVATRHHHLVEELEEHLKP